MTKNARLVLEALQSSTEPKSAGDLARSAGLRCDLATVYRVLHRLEGEGLLDYFVFECHERGIERYYLPKRTPHRHFFHCETCHSFIELGDCVIAPIIPGIEKKFGFAVETHSLSFSGICADCIPMVEGTEHARWSAP